MTFMTLTKAILMFTAAVAMVGCTGTGRDAAVATATGRTGETPASGQENETPASTATAEVKQGDATSLSLSFMLEETRGEVLVSIFSDEEGWEANEPVRAITRPADSARIDITVDDLPPGTYAIKAFHDANGNGELDTNLIGIPTEPYGFSNGQAGRFGPPSFEAASFSLDGVGHQDIGLN